MHELMRLFTKFICWTVRLHLLAYAVLVFTMLFVGLTLLAISLAIFSTI